MYVALPTLRLLRMVQDVSQWIVVMTQQQRLLFTKGEVVSTQRMLPGFSVPVDELLA